MNTDSNHDGLPDWIKQLRSQSWQIEILIAGSTVYTLFYLSDHLRSLFYAVYPGIDFNLEKTLMLFGVYLVSRILLIGFTANLIIRAVWLAYLGINFAFPDGINYDRLKNNEESKEILRNQPNILYRVSLLERLSKLSYSLAVLLAIFMTSVFIITICIHLFLEKIGFGQIIYEAWFSYSLAILIAVIQIGVIDRFFLSKPSKRPIVNSIKKKLSLFLEYVTLSFLFRREFLAIKSNTNRWALSLSAVFILGLSSIISAYQIGKYWPYGTFELNVLDDRKFYDVEYDPVLPTYDYDINITRETSVLRASIQSEIIKSRYIKLFVTSWAIFDKKLKDGYDKFNYPNDFESNDDEEFYQTKLKADSIFNLVINDIFTIEIDALSQQNLRWRSSRHPITRTKGYTTFIDIDTLSKKEHSLVLHVNFFSSKNEIRKKRWKEILFWKE
ncbi:MAG: hypothetical protein ACI86M_001896 [Saprospiraceae bacterium]|jgi:hypothetical protein